MSKRPLGSLRQLGEGKWLLQVSAGSYRNGKRRRVTKRVSGSRAAAERELSHLLAAAPMGDASPDLTLEDYLLRTWLPSKTDLQATTRDFYLYKIQGQILPLIGQIPLSRLTPMDLQRWTTEIVGGQQTKLHAFRVLSNALNQAVKWELIARNPLKAVSTPKAPAAEIIRPTLEEALQIIDLSRGTSIEGAVALALGASLRRSEVAGLKWEQVDLEKKTVSVVRKRVRLKNHDIIGEPKTARSKRTLTMTTWAADVLKGLRVRQLEQRLASPVMWLETDYVVVGDLGKPLAPASISHRLRQLRRKAGMREITFHGLRHGFATLSVLAGVDLPTLSGRMGHSNLRMTQAYYEIVAEADQRAAEKLDVLFARTPR